MATTPSPVRAPRHILDLLSQVHALSEEQEAQFPSDLFKSDVAWGAEKYAYLKDKFIALTPDKCQLVYQLLLATGATKVVEAGTSFGVSTVYLALAVVENVKAGKGDGKGLVIGTELEKEKADRARAFWKDCGKEVEDVIELREGDLLQTLKNDLPQVDCLLLDIWAPLTLPTLQIVEKNFKRGSLVICDNSILAQKRYKDLLGYLRRENGPYRNLTLPYDGGLEFCIYLP
ncbi:S-adenosyl-L-methionine-dependent methyltransferase [Atractiella rhizophila]|nr:S-adenosyl-L-methionine-dependent methyltransferase [Atractiella rhizophila]